MSPVKVHRQYSHTGKSSDELFGDYLIL